MTQITVVKTETGLLGMGDKDKTAYGKFKKMIDELGEGEYFTFDYHFERNPKLNALHHVLITAVFDAQETFYNVEHLRDWLKLGARFVVWVPGPDGQQVPIPDSTKFARCDEEKFKAFHEDMVKFLRSTRATRALWPHLDDRMGSEMVESILSEFEKTP